MGSIAVSDDKCSNDGVFDLYMVGQKAKVGPAFTNRGCYGDRFHDRAMKTKLRDTYLSLHECSEKCKAEKSYYFGYQWQRECWCAKREEVNTMRRHGTSVHCRNGMGGTLIKAPSFDLFIINH